MALSWIPIAQGVLAVFLIIELGLTAYIVSVSDEPWWSDVPSSFAFMLFNSIWSILVLLYVAITPRFLPRLYFPIAGLALLVITTIFWFSGATAMAAFIGTPDCHGNSFCQSAKAAVAFGYFIFFIFLPLAVFEGIAFARSRGHGAHADTVHHKHHSQGSV